MIINKISVKNFRNIETAEFSPHESMNIIFGQNAQGKTSIIEAIWIFTGMKSFRGAKTEELIKIGENAAEIKIDFIEGGRKQTAKIKYGEKTEVYLNEVKKKSASELIGNLTAVIFSPADLELVTAGPAVRRKFIDSAVCQIYPGYSDVLKNYIKALKQRNQILKDLRFHPELEDLIEVYECELANFGSKIIKYRKRYLELGCESITKIYEGLSGGRESLRAQYVPTAGETAEEFLELLRKSRYEDSQTLATSVGPHRDNIEILINGLPARNYGSQGQKRSAALTLKLAEAEILKTKAGKQPVALLDDVMSELDTSRQDYILNHIKGWQVFITCCDPSNIKNLPADLIFEVSGGKLI